MHADIMRVTNQCTLDTSHSWQSNLVGRGSQLLHALSDALMNEAIDVLHALHVPVALRVLLGMVMSSEPSQGRIVFIACRCLCGYISRYCCPAAKQLEREPMCALPTSVGAEDEAEQSLTGVLIAMFIEGPC